ncbi:MAG: type II toxin-antitoxin system RelE/ParE family toxin [Candidatus Firestonebacteria bacterium]|nr:type II toxin-antitoxin system RelE/ParE family toxin [Candidatus Firestonebacteria bacterium]
MEAFPREIRNYQTQAGREPFVEWLIHLTELQAKVAITKQLERAQFGNLGDCKAVGEGVLELEVPVGPGYRVYLGQDGKFLVILPYGGEKHTRKEDVKLAKKYGADYKLRRQEGESRYGS